MKSGPFLSLQPRSWIPYGVLGGALIVTFVAALYVDRTTRALASGFQSYLAKPIEPADLIDVVGSLTR
jgi:CheY-like chemotaxis protein